MPAMDLTGYEAATAADLVRAVDDATRDEDGSPIYLGRPREEPDCGLCNDSRTVRGGRLNRRLLRRQRVPCPSCSPTMPIQVYQWSRLAVLRAAAYRLTPAAHRGRVWGDSDDGAPF